MIRKGDVRYSTRPGASGPQMAEVTPSGAVVVEPAPASPTIITEQKWPPMAVALLRGAIIGALLASVNFLTCIQLDFSPSDSAVSAGLVFCTNMLAALGIGQMDQFNARKG